MIEVGEQKVRIIDTFQFAGPSETDVFLTKLNLSKDVVSEWLVCENDYTHQGGFKGHFLREILKTDHRFGPFLDRIKLFEGSNSGVDVSQKDGINDQQAIENEYFQRELSRDYLLKTYSKNDYVLLSDCDECLWVDSTQRKSKFEKLVSKGGNMIQLTRKRFWYDIDNLWGELRTTPLFRIGHIETSGKNFTQLRYGNINFDHRNTFYPFIVEYSFCFSRDDIFKKYASFIHTGFKKEEIIKGLECNHLPESSVGGRFLDDSPKWWLKKVPISRKSMPAYVVANEKTLRTSCVSKNFIQNRKRDYPQFFAGGGLSIIHRNAMKRNLKKSLKRLLFILGLYK